MERLRCKKCGEFLVSAQGYAGPMREGDLILFFKMVDQPDPLEGYVCGSCGGSSFEIVEVEEAVKQH